MNTIRTKRNSSVELKTGDIIKARVIKIPLISHVGIVVVKEDETIVYHNTPIGFNKNGGSIQVTPLKEWLSTRIPSSVTHTDLVECVIKEKTQDLLQKKFNTFSFNCEHYTYFLKDGKARSPQLIKWIVGTAISIIL